MAVTARTGEADGECFGASAVWQRSPSRMLSSFPAAAVCSLLVLSAFLKVRDEFGNSRVNRLTSLVFWQ